MSHQGGGTSEQERGSGAAVLRRDLKKNPGGCATSGTIQELVAERDIVVARFSGIATHAGELMGAAPTGKTVTMRGMEMTRIKSSKATEVWHDPPLTTPHPTGMSGGNRGSRARPALRECPPGDVKQPRGMLVDSRE